MNSETINQLLSLLNYVKKDRVATVSATILALVILLAITAGLFVQFDLLADPYQMDLLNQVAPPSAKHILGTDSYGRDVLSRIIFGARVSLSVGAVAVGISALVALPLGMIAGYFGGRLDRIIMRVMDAFLSLPPILLALIFVAALGSGVRNVMLALGIVYSPRLARVIRAKTLSIREEEYILAAKSLGASHLAILVSHVFPNVFGTFMVQSTVAYGYSIIAEAGLSFLGVGTQPPVASWGFMISEARSYLVEAPWYLMFPSTTLAIVILSITLLGDRLREAFDPRQRE